MRCCSVRLLLVVMFATQHTDFESFAKALGALLVIAYQRMARIAYRTIDSEVGGAPPARLRAGM
jgi:hypothetical protein